jgi:acetolactate synthase I/II/III large subunit
MTAGLETRVQLTSERSVELLSGGQLLVECLLGLGASKVFGVPGESYLAVLDALFDTQPRLDFVLCRNEGGAGFMAAAYGKLTGRPGLCFVTRGPGATNAAIGVHTAMQDSAPMILFVGQVGLEMRGREAFQELDYRAVFGSMAKWVVEIESANRIPELLMRAWSIAVSGRPGPVVVALPEDMLQHAATAMPLVGGFPLAEPTPSAAALAEARALLAAASRPVILVAGCNWTDEGKTALKAFAEQSAIPVVTGFRAQDQFDNGSSAYAGEAGVGMGAHVRTLIRDADAILAINARLGEITTDGYSLLRVPTPAQTLIHVHPSEREIGKVYAPRLGIQAGPNAFSRALAPVRGEWSEWNVRARTAQEDSLNGLAQPSPVDMVAVMRYLRERLPPDVILTNGAGNFTVWPNKFFCFGPRARLLAPQSGAMGYGLPAAIAAKIAHPDRMVVCFAGDGDFQMNCQELGTARQAGAQPIVLVLNNGMHGTIRAHQERRYPGRVYATTLENPDFAALARAYGYHAERIEETTQFPAAFERACGSRSGALLELAIAAEAITPRQTISQIRERALAAGGKQ